MGVLFGGIVMYVTAMRDLRGTYSVVVTLLMGWSVWRKKDGRVGVGVGVGVGRADSEGK